MLYNVTLWDYFNPIDLGTFEVESYSGLKPLVFSKIISIYGNEENFINFYNNEFDTHNTKNNFNEIFDYAIEISEVKNYYY